MKCLKCGAELSEDTKFCSYCGEEIATSKENTKNSSKDSNVENEKNSSINKNHKFIRENANYSFSFICFNVYSCI